MALQHLEHRTETMDADRERLVSVARTSMTGTSADMGDDTLANLIVEALNTVASSDGVDHEDVRMAKRTRGNLHDTRLVDGLVLDAALSLDRLPRRLESGTVLTLTCPLDVEETVRETEIEVERADQWICLLYTSPSPRDATLSRMPSSA